MLAIGSSEVIVLRLVRMAGGGRKARHETELMFAEEFSASAEATASLCGGATPATIIGRHREHVAANASRLAV